MLEKSAAVAFKEQEHPRDEHGRFTDAGGTAAPIGRVRPAPGAKTTLPDMAHVVSLGHHRRLRDRRLNSLEGRADLILRDAPKPSQLSADNPLLPGEGRPVFREKRSNIRNTWAIGARTKELPISYTGSRAPEQAVGSFLQADMVDQKPKALTAAEHKAMKDKLARTAEALREPIVAAGFEPKKRGKRRGMIMIPEGTEKRSIHRAYNHAAVMAMHGYGVGRYVFKMDEATKAELTPLIHFMRYTKRRLGDAFMAENKGGWRPYRQEFGQPFKDNRRDKITGEIRLRVPPMDQFVKSVFEDDYTGLDLREQLFPEPLEKAVLTTAQLEQRRAAARARWQGHNATHADLARPMREAHPVAGDKITPKDAVRYMRRWGRTNRTERAMFLDDSMTHVHGRSIGNRAGVGPNDATGMHLVEHPETDGFTLVHNHSEATPLSIPDAIALGSKEQMKLSPYADDRVISMMRQPRRIMAADPNGAVSVMSYKEPAAEAYKKVARVSTLHGILNQRRIFNAMKDLPSDLDFEAVQEAGEAAHYKSAVALAPMAHGHWTELARRGVLNYATTGNYNKIVARAGERLVRLAEHPGTTARKIVEWSFKKNPMFGPGGMKLTEDMIEGSIKQIQKTGLFKFDDGEKRDADGRWSLGGKLAAIGAAVGVAAMAPRANRQLKLHGVIGALARLGHPADVNGTKGPNIYQALRHIQHVPDHLRDLVTKPTAMGKKPTGKQIRRQLARDSFMSRERLIITDPDRRVVLNQKGTSTQVEVDTERLDRLAARGKVARMIHNHTRDTPPSTPDVLIANQVTIMTNANGHPPPTNLVYATSRTPGGKTRTRVMRYDLAPAHLHEQRRTSPLNRAVRDALPEIFGSEHHNKPFGTSLKNLSFKDWRDAQAAGSNFRDKAVEKFEG